jgi:hypothetical protein
MQSSIRWLAVGFALGAPYTAVLFGGERSLPAGSWGGDKLILEVVADGAEVEFECARGRISKAIKLDRRGDFDLPGTLGAEGRGPVRDGASAATKARYRGHVERDTMTLTVVSGNERMGPYTLTRDRRPILKKCR